MAIEQRGTASAAGAATRVHRDRDETAASLPRRGPEGVACTLQLMINISSRPTSFVGPGAAAQAPKPQMLRLILQPRIVRGPLKVSLGVGTVLNIINNGVQLWTHHAVNLG